MHPNTPPPIQSDVRNSRPQAVRSSPGMLTHQMVGEALEGKFAPKQVFGGPFGAALQQLQDTRQICLSRWVLCKWPDALTGPVNMRYLIRPIDSAFIDFIFSLMKRKISSLINTYYRKYHLIFCQEK